MLADSKKLAYFTLIKAFPSRKKSNFENERPYWLPPPPDIYSLKEQIPIFPQDIQDRLPFRLGRSRTWWSPSGHLRLCKRFRMRWGNVRNGLQFWKRNGPRITSPRCRTVCNRRGDDRGRCQGSQSFVHRCVLGQRTPSGEYPRNPYPQKKSCSPGGISRRIAEVNFSFNGTERSRRKREHSWRPLRKRVKIE